MKIQFEVAESFRRAAEEAAALAEMSAQAPAVNSSRFGPLFDLLRGSLTTLPIPRDTYAVLTNMVADAEALIAQRELGAARWQLRQTMRRLRRLEGDWSRDASAVVKHASCVGSSRRLAESNRRDKVDLVRT